MMDRNLAGTNRIQGRRLVALLCALAAAGAVLILMARLPVRAADPAFGTPLPLGPGTDDTYALVAGDLDGNGTLDVVAGNLFQANGLYLNDGTGSFVLAQAFGDPGGQTRSVAAGDLDGDGDLDLVTGDDGGANAVYLNQGGGSLAPGSAFGPGDDPTYALALGDLNGDGAIDLAVGNQGTANVVYLNQGDGSLLPGVPFGPAGGQTRALAAGDLDGDGDLDLAAGDDGGANVLYLNAGDGTFPLTLTFGSGSDATWSLVAGDLDGDGDLDLAAGDYGGQNAVYWNDGSGRFDKSQPFGSGSDWTTALAAGDLDGDGDLDLAAGDNQGGGQVYFNDGSGQFTARAFGGDSGVTNALIVGDANGDGALEPIAGNIGQNVIYLNDGSGEAAGQPFGPALSETTALGLGDLDGDGDLDLAAGNWGSDEVYLNDGAGGLTARPLGASDDETYAVAAGDLDGDGDLDLALGNRTANVLYLNQGDATFPLTRTFGGAGTWTWDLALGDLDGDGDLEMVAGNYQARNVVYWNAGDATFPLTTPFGTALEKTNAVALGDVDGDGDLDVVAGNDEGPNAVYLNDGGGGLSAGRPFGLAGGRSASLALGDVDGDGDLDVAVGNQYQQNAVYLNDGGGRFPTSRLFGTGADATLALVAADVDGDGDVDLAAGNDGQNALYLNDGRGNFQAFAAARIFGSGADATFALAAGDLDGDGTIDLAAGNFFAQNATYANPLRVPARLANNPPYATVIRPGTTARAGFFSTPQILAGVTIPLTYTLYDREGDLIGGVAVYYSQDGGGSWQPAVPAPGSETAHLATDYEASSTLPVPIPDPGTALSNLNPGVVGQVAHEVEVALAISHTAASQLQVALASAWPAPTGTHLLLFQGVGGSGDGFDVVLADRAARPITATAGATETVRGLYRPAQPLTRLAGAPLDAAFTLLVTDTAASGTGSLARWALRSTGAEHRYVWNTFESRFFGQSDNVVLRLVASPQPAAGAAAGTYPYPDGVPGPYQWPYAVAETFPLRVRGTQVRVLSGTLPVEGALVYRLPAGAQRAAALANNAGQPFQTDALGYLQGRGTVGLGDTLVALLPITHTQAYTLYYTNADPTETGLVAHQVTAAGVQTLTVSAQHPLALFNLDLSLEWDARHDGSFLADLERAVERASAVLYDVSDGQAALGRVRLHQAEEQWLTADVVMYAQNGIRPRATMGGVVEELTNDLGPTGVITNAYGPGQVRMGPNWDPFGQNLDELSQDWQRALAHELAHYLLYLPDNYLGVGPEGVPIHTDCKGSFMTSTYDDAYSEFLTRVAWDQDPECLKTVAELTTGRADWQTVQTFYQALISPAATNAGPGFLPLEVMTWLTEPLAAPAETLPPLFFDLRDADSEELLPVRGAQGYLFQTQGTAELDDDGVLALGSTVGGGDRIKVRGAVPGDRLCVLGPFEEDLQVAYAGCLDPLDENDRAVPMARVTGWQPNVVVQSITSRTMAITVTLPVSASNLHVQVFPAYGPPTAPVHAPWAAMLPLSPTQAYTFTRVITLEQPAFEGLVRVWVPRTSPGQPVREALSSLYLSPPWGGESAGVCPGCGDNRAWGANHRQLGAPVASGDGQVTVFNLADIFADTGTVSLQAVNDLPNLPAWLTPLGQGYRFTADEVFSRAIMFSYLQREVPDGYEHTLRIYYSPDEGRTWQRLATDLDQDRNQAATRMPDDVGTNYGQGIYVVASTVEMPPFQAGWNLFGYPLPVSRAVTPALVSIEGAYTTVYYHDALSGAWYQHDEAVLDEHPAYADLVNNLHAFEFGRAYWLYATEAITLYLGVPQEGEWALTDGLELPPATFYGPAVAADGFEPAVGMAVTATVDGLLCGSGVITDVAGGLGYRLRVVADTGYGCGAPGRQVVLQAGGRTMVGHAWDNSRAWYHPLQPRANLRFYLPLIPKGGTSR